MQMFFFMIKYYLFKTGYPHVEQASIHNLPASTARVVRLQDLLQHVTCSVLNALETTFTCSFSPGSKYSILVCFYPFKPPSAFSSPL